MASLFVIRGRDQGKRFELDRAVARLGRERGNDLQVRDNEVSRQHAELRRVDDAFWLTDLKSSNGTFVNAKSIDRCRLQNGDRVQLGRTLMVFTGDPAESPPLVAGGLEVIALTEIDGNSRIVRSLSQEESSLPADGGAEESPWLARARSNLQIMYRTALEVSHTLDVDQLLQSILGMIFEWVEADRGCVMLINDETGELEPAARMDRNRQETRDSMEISRTILDYVMQHNEGVLTSNARDDERWDSEGSILRLGVREAICVPLQGRYGVVGVIYIDTFTAPDRQSVSQRPVNRFSEEHLKLMIAIGHQAALAVEDTAYYSAMVQAERLAAMGQTIATLSHHIKNILQGIRGGSYLIEEGLKEENSEVVLKGWRIVEKNQERISSLVMDMLSFGKDREPDLRQADLNELAQDVCDLMQARARESGVALELHQDLNVPAICFDYEGLHRALLNVVGNALDACEERSDGVVRVSTGFDAVALNAFLEVQDNGPGIPAEEIKDIFSVFHSRKGSRGTGLGLPVSRKVLNEHGGDVLVESKPGEGSRFVLQWPAILPSANDGGQTVT